jgi:subtilisin-like proprotein convertase family protein
VTVDIEHTYIGDLVVTLHPPAALGIPPVELHRRAGGATDNLKTTYDEVNRPALAALKGKKPKGTWTLEVSDQEAQDVGRIRSFSLEMGL